MKASAIGKLLRERPLEPWLVILDNGDRHRILNIDAMAVGPDQVHLIDSKGDYHFVAPSAISEMRPLKKVPARRNRGR